MMNDLYSNALLEAAGSIPEAKRLDAAMATSRKVSRVCGSEVTVDLAVKDGRVSDFAMEVKACALGQASSAIVSRHIIGEQIDVLRQLHQKMWAMLRGEIDMPMVQDWALSWPKGWEELTKLAPIRDYAARHASTMLIFDAVVDCLDQIEQKES